MKLLSKADLAAVERRPVVIPVPEIAPECGVCVRLLSGRQREKLLGLIAGIASDTTVALHAIAAAACISCADETLIFSTIDEVEETIKSPDAVLSLGREILRVNGLLKTSLEDAKKN